MIGTGFPDPDGLTVRVDETRCLVEVQTTSGRAAAVEFRVRLDMVEVWHREHCAGVFDRDALRAWLIDPAKPLSADEVELSLDRWVDQDGRVAITMADVSEWTLSPREQMMLCAMVGAPDEGG